MQTCAAVKQISCFSTYKLIGLCYIENSALKYKIYTNIRSFIHHLLFPDEQANLIIFNFCFYCFFRRKRKTKIGYGSFNGAPPSKEETETSEIVE